MSKIKNVTLGSDIEFFLRHRETGEMVSAEGYAKGTKEVPFIFDASNRFWATSQDNVAYEGNIPPVNTKEDWRKNITRLIDYINSTLPPQLCTVAIPAFDFDPKYLNTEATRQFGCSETYNCWTKQVNPSPNNFTNLRSTGKHIHAAWEEMDIETIENFIKSMDLFCGVPSVILEPANKRRELYGKAGEFRFSSEIDRAEYRVLSSYFASSEELIDYTYDQTHLAIDYVNEGNIINTESTLGQDIIRAINTSNKDLAEKIVRELNIPILA